MLKSLSIRNVVLIDKLDLDLQGGLTVFSGETGAGKSVLLDSLELLCGGRADTGMIRNGCDKLSVTGCFEVADKSGRLHEFCKEHDLDFADGIIISRSLTRDGKGKIFFNDRLITQKLLREAGAFLAEINSQFESSTLLNPANYTSVLDGFGGYKEALGEVREAYANWRKAVKDREELQNRIESAAREEDDLRCWIKEFEAIKPAAGEIEELEKKRTVLMNSEKLLDNFNLAYNALQGQSLSVREALRQAQSAISRVNGMTDNKYDDIYTLLDTALVNAEEASRQIEVTMRETALNQNDVDAVEERIFTLKDLARKHRAAPEDLPEVWKNMEDRLAALEKSSVDLQVMQKTENQAKEAYISKAGILHEERLSAAAALDAKMKADLPSLKLEKARFVTEVAQKDESSWSENGTDEVHFMFSANTGTELAPLNKTASGGELSRLLLALKSNLGQSSEVETMVFDEIDSGVGGATALAVGEKLAKLGETVQVLAVTHSPQVAAKSDVLYKVNKYEKDGATFTQVSRLDGDGKQEEIARMLSGETVSDEARAAAKILLGG